MAAAKNEMLMDSSYFYQNPLMCVGEGAQQALLTKTITTEDQMPELVKSITVGDVQAVAKKLSSGKLSMSAVGNLKTVPYLDKL